MKRYLILIVTLAPIAYLAGRLRGARKSKPEPIVVSPPDVYVYPKLQEPIQRPQSRLERHKLLVDPYVLLVVTLISVLLSGLFAGLTWKVNQGQEDLLGRQTDLMAQQAEVQSANTLPIFQLKSEVLLGDDGNEYSQITLVNVGGMARYQQVTLYPAVQVVGEYSDNQQGFSPSVWIILHNYYGQPRKENRSLLWQQNWTWSDQETSVQLNQFYQNFSEYVSETYGMRIVSRMASTTFKITYTDYQGIDRTEYYTVSIPTDDLTSDTIYMQPDPATEAEDRINRYEEAGRTSHFLAFNWFYEDESWRQERIKTLALLLYSSEREEEQATPVP